MKKLSVDIMTQRGARFYGTIVYEYNPLFKFDMNDLMASVYKKYPTLKSRNDVELVIDYLYN